MKTTILKIILLFFILTQTSFVYCDTGDGVRDLFHNGGKLFKTLFGFIGAASKNEEVQKVAKAGKTVGGMVMDAAGPEAAQRNKEAEERRIKMVNDAYNKYRPQRPQSQQEKVNIEQEKEDIEQGPEKFKIIIYNDSDYNIIVRDFIGSKSYTIGTIRAPEPIYRRDGTSYIAPEAITIAPTIENQFPYNFIEISTSDPNRNILDNSLSFVYNKDKVYWRLEGNFPFREARFFNLDKEDEFEEDSFDNDDINETESKTVKNINHTLRNDRDMSNNVSLNNEYKLEENVNSLNNNPDLIETIQRNIPREIITPLPLINNFQAGRYYIQIGSYTNVNTVYSEIAKVGIGFPVAVMKTNVIIKGKDTLVHRVLIGPLNYSESQNLLHKFKTIYNDAFVWYGR